MTLVIRGALQSMPKTNELDLDRVLRDAESLRARPMYQSYDRFLMTCLEIMICVGRGFQEISKKCEKSGNSSSEQSVCSVCKIRPANIFTDGLCPDCADRKVRY